MSISQNFPNTRPSLNLNFARSKTLDPRITFSRTSAATYVDDNGFIKTASADEPRFGHDHTTGESLGLLVEEGRSNYYHRWNPTTDTATSISASLIDTQTTSSLQTPLGVTATAYTATKTGNSGQYHGLNGGANLINITSDTSVSFSAYLKEFNSSDYRLYFVISAYNASTNNRRYCLNVARPSNGTWIPGYADPRWSTPTFNVKDCGNGWYRYEVTSTNTYESGWDIIENSFQLLNESGAQFYDPPTANTHGLYLSAPQVEVGAFPTSYIPIVNTGTTSRTADNVSMTGTNFSDWYNQSEGTIYCSANNDVGLNTSTSTFFYLLENTSNINANFIRQWVWNGNTGLLLNSFYTSNTTGQGSVISAEFSNTLTTDNKKTAVGYAKSDFASCHNGTSLNTDTSGNLPVGIDRLRIGPNLSGHISQLTYYPTRLSNTVLQTLTK